MNSTRKTILLSVTGLSPQVLTETLYALHRQGMAMPARIHILTTAEGAQRARLTLINDGWLQRFYRDYQLPQPEFSERHIHILQQDNGQPLQDIRSQEDNQAMADSITEWIRKLTADSATALHVSIAGGRKTMGFYASYALSLYGRDQARLSHVLVSPDYESHPQFYYPTPESQIIYSSDASHKPLDTRNAEVMLADIPFVRLRHGLDDALLQGRSSFSRSVQRAQQALGPARLEIDLDKCRMVAQDTVIAMRPAGLAFYSWLLQRQLAGQPLPSCPSDGVPDPEYARQYLRQYQAITGELGGAERTLDALQEGMSKSFFEQRKSRINRQLKQDLQQAAHPYLISAVGRRPRTRYEIKLEENQIFFI